MPHRLACAALAFVLALPLSLLPQPAQANCRNAGGNGVLVIACLSERVDDGSATTSEARQLDRRLRELGLEGIGITQDVPRVDSGWQLRPVLRESSGNLLGGEPELEAGAALGWRLRATAFERANVTFGIGGSEAVEPITLDRRARRNLSLCSTTALAPTTHLRLCNNTASHLKRVETNWTNSATLRYSQAIAQSTDRQSAYHIGMERFDDLDEGFFQPRLHLGGATLHRRNGLTGLDLSLGAPVSDRHLLQWRLDGLRRWHPFTLRSHALRKTGRERTTLELGSSISIDAPNGFDLRLGLRARLKSDEDDWRLTPVLGVNFSF